MFDKLLADLRYGCRLLLKHPAFAAVAVLTLALGIGANTAIFTVINGILLRPLPYPDSESLVWAWGKWPNGNQASVSAPDFLDYRAQNEVFDQMGAFLVGTIPFNLTGEGEPDQVTGAFVTANFFRVLGAEPSIGRAFTEGE